MTKITEIKIQSPKGNIAAVINYPEDEAKYLAILCPGYLDSKNYKHLTGLAESLSEQGIITVRFEPIGTWESEGEISDYTTTQYLEDIKNVLNYMTSDKSYKQIILVGHSRGGQVSILYAAKDPRISLVIGIMPSSNRTMTEERLESWEKKGIRASHRDLPEDGVKQKEFVVPFSHADDAKRYDVTAEVRKIKVPIVLIAGELDSVCSQRDVKEIFNNANEPKKFIMINNIGHDYRHNENEIKIVDGKTLEALREYLKS